jgi:sugar phosphate isomerase/epimerase
MNGLFLSLNWIPAIVEDLLGCSTFCYRKLDPTLDKRTKLFGEFTLERALCGISKAGFEFVELASVPGMCHHVMPEHMIEKDFERLSMLLEDFGLKAMSICGHLTLLDKDPEIERKGFELLKRRIELASRLKARIVVTRTTDPMISDVKAVFSDKDIERFYENIKGIIDCCQKNDVVLAIENDGGLTVTAKTALETMRRINSKYVRINYDTASLPFRFGLKPEDELEELMSYVVCMHLKDVRGGKGSYVFPAIGDGELNFGRIFEIVRKHDFKGPFSVETGFGKGDRMRSGSEKPEEVDEIMHKSFRYLQGYSWLLK